MKTLDFILPAAGNTLSEERETLPLPRASKKSAEPFDSLMHRALDKSAREPAGKNAPAKKSTDDTRADRSPKAEPATPRKAKPANRPEPRTRETAPDATGADPATAVSTPDDQKIAAADEPVTPAPAAEEPVIASVEGDNQAATLQQTAVAAYLSGSAAASVTGTTPGTGTAGTAGSGNDSAPITAIGSDPATSAATVGDSHSEPGDQDRSARGKEIPGSLSDPAKISGPAGGKVPIHELMERVEKVEEIQAGLPNPATDKPLSTALDATGISAAEQAATMKKAEHAAKVAGTPEQTLPGVTVVSTLQSTAQPRPATRTAARVESSDAPVTANLSGTDRAPRAPETVAGSPISESSQTELRTRALDRTHDIVAVHGLRLKETNAGSLHVVIKPGAGLQLSLQLQQTADGIQAQAVLQQGDFAQVNQHWAELQQRLEERGIKLAPLGQDGAAMNNPGGENFRRPSQQSAEPGALAAGAFAEFASTTATTGRPAPAPAVASRGWEGWA